MEEDMLRNEVGREYDEETSNDGTDIKRQARFPKKTLKQNFNTKGPAFI